MTSLREGISGSHIETQEMVRARASLFDPSSKLLCEHIPTQIEGDHCV